MTETTEQTIARLAKERAKTILENGDFWGSPGAANTSATAITTLIALTVPPMTIAKVNAAAVATEEAKPARKNAKSKEDAEPESADV